MPDLLVKLYDIDYDTTFFASQAELGISVRKPIGPEKFAILKWMRTNFSDGWASETDVAISRMPSACFIAIKGDELIGVSCYDATALGFFGPIGVHKQHRQSATGTALLRACLLDMKLKGYGYAIIGHSGATAFFQKTTGAIEIAHSTPGIYRTMLQ